GLTKSIALDGRQYDITASQIDVGNADTEMGAKVKSPVLQANGTMSPEPVIDVDQVARAIVYIASLPLDVNVLNMSVMATKMPGEASQRTRSKIPTHVRNSSTVISSHALRNTISSSSSSCVSSILLRDL